MTQARLIESLERRDLLATLSLNQITYETIGTIGDEDHFEFSLETESRLVLDGLSGSNVNWQLSNSAETLLTGQSIGSSSWPMLLSPGDYQLDFSASGDAEGPYSFRLLDVGSPTLISSGATIDGTLAPASQVDAYRLTANAGDVFTFDTTTSAPGNASWRLFDPLHRQVVETNLGSDLSNVELAMGGNYLLLVDGSLADVEPINYSFQANLVGNNPPAPIIGTSLTLGTVRSSTLSEPGEQDHYKFTLTNEGRVYFDALQADPDLVWSLRGPAGVEVNALRMESSLAFYGVDNSLNLVAGDYQLTISAINNAAGNYTFRVSELASAQTYTLGNLVNGILDPASETDAFRFTATAGQRLFFDSQTSSPQNSYWRVLDPFGRTIQHTYFGSDLETSPLLYSGTYTLLIEGYFYDTGSLPYAFVGRAAASDTKTALNIGDTIVSSIGVTGERDTYTFSLASDSRLVFDSLTPSAEFNWTLQNSSGLVIANRQFFYDSSISGYDPMLQLSRGDYVLTVDGLGVTTGDYSFRLSDLMSAQAILLGDTVSGELNPAFETNTYNFTVADGQRLFLNSLSSNTANAYWRLINPLGQTIGGAYLSQDIETAPLSVTGTYSIIVEGYAGDTDVIPYSFKVQPVADLPATALTLGSVVSNSISTAGEVDLYSFNLPAAGRYYFDALPSVQGTTWSLSGPSGLLVPNRPMRYDTYYYGGLDPSLDLPAGDYTLSIDGVGDAAGAYAFRMFDQSSASELTYNDLVSGTLSAGATTAFKFSAAAGERYFINSESTNPGSTVWRLLDPLGRTIHHSPMSNGVIETTYLTLPGTYTVLIEGYYLEDTSVAYAFRLHQLVDPTPTALTLDTDTPGTLTVPGQQDHYTFTLTAKSRLYFDGLATSSGLAWYLSGPAGVVVSGRGLHADNLYHTGVDSQLDLIAGDYELVVDGSGSAIGSYKFRMQNLTSLAASPLGTLITGDLSPANSTQAFRFAATAGQRIYVDSQTENTNASWRLVAPNGQSISSAHSSSNMETGLLTQTGNYLLLLEGYFPDTGSQPYAFTINTLDDAAPVDIAVGDLVAKTLTKPGELVRYDFSITADSQVYFDALKTVGQVSWSLRDATGFLIFENQFDANSSAGPYVLPASDYQLTVHAGELTGDISFKMLDLAGATSLPLDTLTNGNLNPASETDIYAITVAAGDILSFDSTTSTPLNASWRLIDPVVRTLFASGLANDQSELSFAFGGTYFLLIEGRNSDTDEVAYEFQVNLIDHITPQPWTGTTITLGETVSSSISVGGEEDNYLFTISDPVLIYMDSLDAPGGIHWTLEGPTGIEVFQRDLTDDRIFIGSSSLIIRAVPGQYRIKIGGSVGDYSFRMLDLSQAVNLTPGSLVTSSLSPGGETDAYRFTASAGDQFYFALAMANSHLSAWKLIDPLGRPVWNSSLGNGDVDTQTLARDGDYTLLVEGYLFADERDYSILVYPVLNTAPEALTFNETFARSIDAIGQTDRYDFTLGTASRLYFDALTSADNLNWSLIGAEGFIVTPRGFSYEFYNFEQSILYLQPGDYSLVIDGIGRQIGDYSFRILDLTVVESIDVNQSISGQLSPQSEMNAYTFTASAGQQFYIDLQSATPSSAQWYVIDPIGRRAVAQNYLSDLGYLTATLAGTYTLLVNGYLYDGATVDYAFAIQEVVDNNTVSILLGETVDRTLATVGEIDTYSFTVNAATQLYFDAISSDGRINWSLTGPSGAVIDSKDIGSDGTWIYGSAGGNFLAAAGSYLLTVFGVGDATGGYAFRMVDLSASPLIPLATLVEGTLSPATEMDSYRFNGVAGDTFYFDSVASSTFGPSWRLIDPFGAQLVSTNLANDIQRVLLPVSGTYYLLVDGYFTDTEVNSYGFIVQPLPTTVTLPLVFGETVLGDIVLTGEEDDYTFTLPTAGRYLFDALGASSGINWSLTGPAGTLVSSTAFENDGIYLGSSSTILSLSPGNYRLKVDGVADSIGHYEFHMLDLAAATPMPLGSVVTGTLSPANETNTYQFTATAGQRLYFDSQTAYSTSAWRLLDPSGRTVSTTSLYNDLGRITLFMSGTYSLLVEGSFSETNPLDYALRVQLIDPEPADTTLSANTTAENKPINTLIGSFLTSDVDETSTQVYTLVSGAGATDNGRFAIVGNGLRTAVNLDYEAQSSYSIRVRTTDNIGLSFERVFAILVTNVNEVPTDIALVPGSIAENSGINATVGSLSSSDPDFGDAFTYALVAGTGSTDNDAFTVSGTSLRAKASFNFEAKDSYSVRIRTTDSGGLTLDKIFSIAVTNVNEAPTDVGLSATSIPENAGTNATVGILTSTDEDLSETFTYSLVAGAGSTDNAQFAISGGVLLASPSFNFESRNSYEIRIRTTDAGGLSFEKPFVIAVTNVNEAPTDIALSASSIAENAAANTAVGLFTTSDPDAANTFTYTLVAGSGDADNAAFSVSGTSLVANAGFNFEAQSNYLIRVRSTDQGGLSAEQTFVITVTNVNEAPTNIALSATTVVENKAANTLIGSLTTTDPDAANTFTYELVVGADGTDNAAFTISGTSLIANSSFDFESKSSYSIRVRTTDQGGLSFEKALTISITDMPELVGSAVFGDGTAQRSMIQTITVTFDGAVTIASDAFTVVKRGAGGGIVTLTATPTINALGQTVVVLTFSGQYARGSAGSLSDGYYQLTIDGSKISRAGQQLDVNRDGQGGDSYSIGASEADNFFALYGDTDGDGLVGIAEFGEFRAAFGKLVGDVGYNMLFDYEGDGAVGISDFGQFRSRFGKAKMVF